MAVEYESKLTVIAAAIALSFNNARKHFPHCSLSMQRALPPQALGCKDEKFLVHCYRFGASGLVKFGIHAQVVSIHRLANFLCSFKSLNNGNNNARSQEQCCDKDLKSGLDRTVRPKKLRNSQFFGFFSFKKGKKQGSV